nr:nephrin-like [Procambarus clarkii]
MPDTLSASVGFGDQPRQLETSNIVDKGAAGQIQVFRVRPENVQVRAGDDVFLKCVVENQQGKAQWTKDGFALGFERGVPGYPRYQYAGDASAGEHHLVIKGITLEDDGEYQCQVGPTTSSLPIWAAANVTVMVPPSSIVMLGRSEGEIVEVKAGERLQLECLVSDARPVPNVTWHRDDHRIEPKLQTDVVQPSATRRRLLSVVSRLVLTATEEDDGEELSCRTQHPALKDPAAPAQPLTASVTLSVLHPPGKPVIHGYKTGEVLRAGERRTLTCRVLGGNPRPWVTWYWHGLPLNHTAKSKSRKSVYLKAKATSRKGKKTRGVSVTQQVTASRTEDGAVYECRVSSDLLQRPLTTNVTLTVHYAPAQVRVSGSTVVAAGEEFSLTCVSSPANPPASITWLVDGAQVNTTTTRESKDEGGGWVTTSLLTQEAARSGQVREMVVTCQAHHLEAGEAISHTRSITVIRAPGAPVIEVQARGQVVAGTNLDVSCTSKGGHPPPQFRIYKGGDQELETETQTSGNTSRARASFRAAPADNGAHLTCAVTNPALATPLVVNTTLSLLFAPWEVRGTASPQSVEAGQVVKLTCETSASVPASSVTWHSRAHLLGDPYVRHSLGLFGGTVTRSEVKIRTEAEDNGQEVTCRAENGLGISVTGNITLEVLHGPVWIRVPSGTLNVLEGKEETLTAAAMANPGPITYSWWRGNDEVGGVESRGGELRMGVLSRRHAHNYTVTARSPKGALTSAFFLNVQYGPEGVVTEERVTIEQGGSASILCSAGGNPTPNITWTRDADNTSAPLVMSSGVGEARLVVERASRTDSSVYLCHASSSVASAPPASSTLIVQQAPWWPSPSSEEGVGGSWAALGGRGRLECRMRAAPEPTFHWATQDGRDVQAGHKYTLQDVQLSDGVVEWTSVVEIREVAPGDYGRYVCSAVNALGKHSVPLVLSPPVPPATPSHLTVSIQQLLYTNSILYTCEFTNAV